MVPYTSKIDISKPVWEGPDFMLVRLPVLATIYNTTQYSTWYTLHIRNPSLDTISLDQLKLHIYFMNKTLAIVIQKRI